jgi:MYXO-CTERM domain-containing protein
MWDEPSTGATSVVQQSAVRAILEIMRIRRALPLLAGSAILVLAACGVQRDGGSELPQISHTSSAIVGGVKDSGSANDAVLLIMHQLQGSSYGEMCTASLISMHVLVTARHCVGKVLTQGVNCNQPQNDMGADFTPADIYVMKGVDPSQSGYAISVGKQIYHTPGASLCDNDFAVIRLAQGIMGIPPLRVRINTAPYSGEKFRAIGYGLTNPSDQNSSGVRYYRDNVTITHTSSMEFEGTASICQGDSGGPALSQAGSVFGITSRGADCWQDYNTWSRLDKYKAIIDQAAADANETYMDEDGTVFGNGGSGGSGGTGGSGGSNQGGSNQGGSGGSNQGGSNQGGNNQGGSGGGTPPVCDESTPCPGDQVCANDGMNYCAALCSATDKNCPTGYRCSVSGSTYYCARTCDGEMSCPGNMICATDGHFYCTLSCSEANPDCPAGYQCVYEGDTTYCARPQPSTNSGSTGGCSVTSQSGSSGAWAFAAFGLAALLASRKRRAG